jgi:hypothetical protein
MPPGSQNDAMNIRALRVAIIISREGARPASYISYTIKLYMKAPDLIL